MKQCDPNHIHDEPIRGIEIRLNAFVDRKDGFSVVPATVASAVGEELILFLRDKEPTIKRLLATEELMLKIRADFKSNQFGPVAFVLFWVLDGKDKAKNPIVAFIKFFNPHNQKELSFWHRLAEAGHWHLLLMVRNQMRSIVEFENYYNLEDRLNHIVRRVGRIRTGHQTNARKLFMQEFSIEELIKYADCTAERNEQAKQIQRSIRPPRETELNPVGILKELETIKELVLRYPNFKEVLKFAKKHKLPTCKCGVWATQRYSNGPSKWGYSNGLLHTVGAICFFLEDDAQGEGQFEMSELSVKRRNDGVYVCIEDWEIVYFLPLTPAEIKKVKPMTQANPRKSAKKATLKKQGKRRNDPFETGLSLYPYMPGGEWNLPE